jgi:tetratricopeptide (TPR) repeat protein
LKKVRHIIFVFSAVIVIGQVGFGLPAKAYFEGGFPGRGGYEDWQKANLEYYQGVQLQQDGKIEQALERFDRARQIYKFDSRYWNSIGVCRQQEGNRADAEHAFRQATSVNPAALQGWVSLRGLLKLEGRDGEATAIDVRIQRINAGATPGAGATDQTEWHEKEEPDKETPMTLLKKYLGN